MTSETTPSNNTREDTAVADAIDTAARTAQDKMEAIAGSEESARASASAIAEMQTQIAAILADIQAKLAEVNAQASAVKTQVAGDEAAVVGSSQEILTRAKGALTDVQAKISDITCIATQAIAAKTAIADDQAVIATKSAHIQNAQDHADKVRAELDRVLIAARAQATEVEGLKARAQVATDGSPALLTEIRTTKGLVDAEAPAITTARQNAEESAAVAKGLADKSAVGTCQ